MSTKDHCHIKLNHHQLEYLCRPRNSQSKSIILSKGYLCIINYYDNTAQQMPNTVKTIEPSLASVKYWVLCERISSKILWTGIDDQLNIIPFEQIVSLHVRLGNGGKSGDIKDTHYCLEKRKDETYPWVIPQIWGLKHVHTQDLKAINVSQD